MWRRFCHHTAAVLQQSKDFLHCRKNAGHRRSPAPSSSSAIISSELSTFRAAIPRSWCFFRDCLILLLTVFMRISLLGVSREDRILRACCGLGFSACRGVTQHPRTHHFGFSILPFTAPSVTYLPTRPTYLPLLPTHLLPRLPSSHPHALCQALALPLSCQLDLTITLPPLSTSTRIMPFAIVVPSMITYA